MAANPDQEPIVCRTTPWYARRKLLLVGMFGAFSAWFFYDYKWGYPAKQKIYEESLRVKAEPDGAEKWRELSKKNNWDESPHEVTTDKVAQQRQFSLGTGAVAVISLVIFLLNRGKTLRADAEAFYTTSGQRVPFAGVYKIDKRKWKHKGLATVFYKDANGSAKTAVLDDLAFGGTDKILDRLMSHFSGELIDLEEEPEASPEAAKNDETVA